MIRPDIDSIEKRAQEATPGPWHSDYRFWNAGVRESEDDYPRHIPVGACSFCPSPNSELVGEFQDAQGRTIHVHKFPADADDWHDIYSASGEAITGNYDYEEGGICSSKQDAEFIAAARTDIPALLAYIRELEAELSLVIEDWGKIK